MSAPVVHRVELGDCNGRRRTIITIVEGGSPNERSEARASTLPAAVRAELLDWLDAESRTADDGVHISAGADTRLAEDAPGVTARVGFIPPPR